MAQVAFLQEKVNSLEGALRANQEKTERIKSRFLSSVSHELRTPMNAILGFSNLMIDKNLPHSKREEYMEHINYNSSSLLNIVDLMIDVSLLEVNELKLKKERCNLHMILKQIYAFFNIDKHKMDKEHIALLLNKGYQGEDFLIYTDGYRLSQVLTSLMHNALKFTEKGVIEFGYEIMNENGKLHFFVKDSGKGILFDKAQSIFEKFEKLEDDLGNTEGGIGLGLTLAKGLVELMGGEIWMESNVFKGTTFHFTINYLKADMNEMETQSGLKLQSIFV